MDDDAVTSDEDLAMDEEDISPEFFDPPSPSIMEDEDEDNEDEDTDWSDQENPYSNILNMFPPPQSPQPDLYAYEEMSPLTPPTPPPQNDEDNE